MKDPRNTINRLRQKEFSYNQEDNKEDTSPSPKKTFLSENAGSTVVNKKRSSSKRLEERDKNAKSTVLKDSLKNMMVIVNNALQEDGDISREELKELEKEISISLDSVD